MNESCRSFFAVTPWAPAVLSLSLLAGCASVHPTPPETSPASVPGPATAGSADYAWVQLGEQGAASARAIITSPNATCPQITVDGQSPVSMSARAVPGNYSGFQGITVCEHPLAPPVTSLSIDGAAPIELPAPSWESDRILVVGDTGCRLKHGQGQPCKGASLAAGRWGFPELAATAAAGSRPDLILHVGDYLYRESTTNGTTCDPFDPGKGWVHCGYNWATWEDDFFAPAEAGSLLRKAPWLYVRGNHEDCNRAWKGYFLFFFNGAAPPSCVDTIDAYPVNLSELDVYVVDSSNEDPASATTSFKWVATDLVNSTTRAWLTTHVPTFYLRPAYAASDLAQRQQLLRWFHVGHIHQFQHYPATVAPQAETVTGGSGTALDPCDGVSTCSLTNSGQCCYGEVSGNDQGEYSYLGVVWDATGSQWDATLFDVDGNTLHTFTVD